MSGSEPDFEKPKPPRRAMSVHDLRKVVTSRHKVLLSDGSVEEAIELLQDSYGADHDSCLGFLAWLRGAPIGEPATKATSMDRVHVVTDPKTGLERRVETQPGSIPPRPV